VTSRYLDAVHLFPHAGRGEEPPCLFQHDGQRVRMRLMRKLPVALICRTFLPFPKNGTCALIRPPRPNTRDVSADRHDTWGGMRWTPKRTDDVRRGGWSSRVVVVPRRWDQVRGDAISALRPKRRDQRATEANKPGLRREREVSRKPLRRECRMFRLTCTDLWASSLFCPRGLRVRPAPGIPCALCFPRGVNDPITRTHLRRGNALARHSEERRDEAIQTFIAARFWIASLRSQ
jgi:hypothetical protein